MVSPIAPAVATIGRIWSQVQPTENGVDAMISAVTPARTRKTTAHTTPIWYVLRREVGCATHIMSNADMPLAAVVAQSSWRRTLGSVLPTTATSADSAVKAKIAADAPLSFLALAQTTSPPATGAMAPIR